MEINQDLNDCSGVSGNFFVVNQGLVEILRVGDKSFKGVHKWRQVPGSFGNKALNNDFRVAVSAGVAVIDCLVVRTSPSAILYALSKVLKIVESLHVWMEDVFSRFDHVLQNGNAPFATALLRSRQIPVVEATQEARSH